MASGVLLTPAGLSPLATIDVDDDVDVEDEDVDDDEASWIILDPRIMSFASSSDTTLPGLSHQDSGTLSVRSFCVGTGVDDDVDVDEEEENEDVEEEEEDDVEAAMHRFFTTSPM